MGRQAALLVTNEDQTENAVWSTKYVNDLPDSAFLHVESGGKKDEEGKTTPRTLRHFPYKDQNGEVDLPHLRNALARIPQSSLSQAVKDKTTAKAEKILEEQKKKATTNQFCVVTLNLQGAKISYRKLQGNQYLVVPMVMLVEGVHAGSNGPLLYLGEDLSKTPEIWNHKPVVVYHPQDNGVGISACSPDVLEAQGVGMIMGAKYEGGKLKAEAWLEEDRLEKVDDRVLEALRNGEMIELSTGLYTDVESTEGDWNGEKYVAIARNYRPDHLAILPDLVGACSIAKGGGLLRNEQSHDTIRADLCRVLQDELNHNDWWIDAVFSDFVVYCSSNKLYKRGYSSTDTGVSLLEGDPVEVVRVTEYRSVDGQYIGNVEERSGMDKELFVGDLILNGAWEESDRPFLMSLEEDQLKKIGPKKDPTVNEEPKTKDEDLPKEDPVANKRPKEESVNKSLTVADYIANAPDGIRDMLASGLRAHEAERIRLSAVISANEKNTFTSEQLEGMNLETLQAVANLARGKQEQEESLSVPSFAGLADALMGNRGDTKIEPLNPPVMNFETAAK